MDAADETAQATAKILSKASCRGAAIFASGRSAVVSSDLARQELAFFMMVLNSTTPANGGGEPTLSVIDIKHPAARRVS
jgi:hypothetical protein